MRSRKILAVACLLALGGGASAEKAKAEKSDKLPITTSSEEARKLYLEGRDLNEKLRATDAHERFKQAVAKDADFAMAHLGLAQTGNTGQEFFDELGKAVALADKASEGERTWILAADAGAKGDAAKVKELFTKLTKLLPKEERGHLLLGGFYFGRQEWQAAIAEYQKCVSINPQFSQPYNQMGYAYRFIEKYPDAESAFKKYAELIPSDPNPYDSLAELYMKMGRFDDSIKQYEKALSIDPNFVASYIGIGNNQMFQGKLDEARKTFAKLASVARNDGEKRAANFWTATSYLHEGKTDLALAEMEKNATIAKSTNDLGTLAGDYNVMGDILLEAGKVEDAAAKYKLQMETVDQAKLPEAVKVAARRNALFDQGRVALAKKDLAGAKAIAADYGKQVAVKKLPFEVKQVHELNGLIASAEGKHAAAAAELEKANLQDPRVLFNLASAYQGKGDEKKAKETAKRAADFNGLSPNYAYVRAKAKQLAG